MLNQYRTAIWNSFARRYGSDQLSHTVHCRTHVEDCGSRALYSSVPTLHLLRSNANGLAARAWQWREALRTSRDEIQIGIILLIPKVTVQVSVKRIRASQPAAASASLSGFTLAFTLPFICQPIQYLPACASTISYLHAYRVGTV